LRHRPPEVTFRRPAPLSQGCEVRASSTPFDTGRRHKFPLNHKLEVLGSACGKEPFPRDAWQARSGWRCDRQDIVHQCSENEFEWIKSGRAEPAPRVGQNWPGCTLSVLVPPNFGAYAKILHRITANYQHVDRRPHRFTEKEIAILKIPPCPEMRSFVQTQREKGEGPRIRWKEIADFLGVPFEPQICHEGFRASMIFAGPFDEVAEFGKENNYQFSPEYMCGRPTEVGVYAATLTSSSRSSAERRN